MSLRCKPLRALLATTVALLALMPSLAAAAPSERDVKVAFLVNFVRFVEWPSDTAAGALVVLEPDPFGRNLDAAVSDATLPLHLVVQRITPPDPVPPCRILFAGKGSGASGLKAAEETGKGILTVGETEEFLARGGILRLAVIDGRVRVEINVDALERSGLRMSSKLLHIATLRHESELR